MPGQGGAEAVAAARAAVSPPGATQLLHALRVTAALCAGWLGWLAGLSRAGLGWAGVRGPASSPLTCLFDWWPARVAGWWGQAHGGGDCLTVIRYHRDLQPFFSL